MSVDPNSEAVEQPTTPLRKLPYTSKKFEAGGHTYFVEDNLSIERYKHFQKMEIELGFTGRFSKFIESIKEAYEHLNNSKIADASVLLMKILEGAIAIDEKTPIALWVATLFINRSDEDRTAWNQALAETKLNDWADIETDFFLIIALSRVESFNKNLKEISDLIQTVGSLREKMREHIEDSGSNYPI